MIKNFKDYVLNEGFLDDIFKDDRSELQIFYDKIKSHLIEIVRIEQEISEKAFHDYDLIIAKVKDLFNPANEFRKRIDALLNNYETASKYRAEYWAERIYAELLNQEKFDLNEIENQINTNLTDLE